MDKDTQDGQDLVESWEGLPLDEREEISQIVIREFISRWVKVFLILLILTVTNLYGHYILHAKVTV